MSINLPEKTQIELMEIKEKSRQKLIDALKQINRTKLWGPGKFYDPESDRQVSDKLYEYICS